MFKNYLKTAWRNFRKNKTTTFINVLGLSIGITAALFVYLIIQYNFSFDKYEPDKDRIYRVVTESTDFKNPGAPLPLYEQLQKNVTGIDKATAILLYTGGGVKLNIVKQGKIQAQVFKNQEGIVFTDNNYFSLFPHKWLAGSPSASFNDPYRLVLSQSRAQLYFPGIPPDQLIGRSIICNDTIRTVISGIVSDLNA
ncbi:MAG TPA: ABC transporter permease, partial [Puia sp.]|nr:ABC transporter permease [Puia sp.]